MSEGYTPPEGWTLYEPPPDPPPPTQSPHPEEGYQAPEGWQILDEETALTLGLEPMEPPEPTLTERMVGRFMGTDVDDPMPITRMSTTIIGAVAGGLAGSKTPTAPGPLGMVINPVGGTILFGTMGAALGAMAPDATYQFYENMGWVRPGIFNTLTPEELRTVASGEALLELATGGGLSVLRQTGRIGSQLLAGADRTIAEAGARQGVYLTPIQVGNRPIAHGFVAVMGRFPLIGGPVRKSAQEAVEQAERAYEALPGRMAPVSEWSEVSERVYSDATELVRGTNEYFSQKYTAVWNRADEMGVMVIPAATLDTADKILEQLAKQVPTSATGFPVSRAPGKAVEPVIDFINESILPLRGTDGGILDIQRQTFRQMDGLLSSLDQQIALLEPGQKRFAWSLLNRLRQSMQLDAIANVRGMEAAEIAADLKAVDTEFSHVMSDIFSTSTAKKFGTVRKRGLRAVEFDETTRTPVDQIARVLINLKSPQAMDELSRLVEPATYSQIAAGVFDQATKAARAKGTFDVGVWARQLGLTGTKVERRAVETMLKHSGTDLTLRDLDDLYEVGKIIQNVEIPNVSTFIARRATIGGVSSLIDGLAPGLALASASAGVGAMGSGLLGIATFVGGGQLISRMLANADAAQALRAVLDKEAVRLVRREAGLRSLRFAMLSLADDQGWEENEFDTMWQIANQAWNAYNAQLDDILPEDEE